MAQTAKITKDKVAIYLDTSKTVASGTWAPEWHRIEKSTIFDLSFNPQSTTEDYIAYETAIEEISGYQPELPQEIAMYRGDDIYDYIEDLVYNLQVGDALRVPVLLMFAPKLVGDALTGEIRAWQIKDARLLLSNFNSVDGKITFTLKLGGTYDRGTVTVSDGAPTFVPASA